MSQSLGRVSSGPGMMELRCAQHRVGIWTPGQVFALLNWTMSLASPPGVVRSADVNLSLIQMPPLLFFLFFFLLASCEICMQVRK